jgi:tetratricopeptide (TPR) repeat protein
MEGDRFLESCLWEQVFNSYNSDAAYGDHRMKEDFQGALASLEMALKKGYPAAHFYNELGSMEALVGNRPEAIRDFKRAIQSPFNATAAAENLKAVEQKGK